MRVIANKGIYKLCGTSRGYIVINVEGEYNNHAHFDSYKGAVTCIDLMIRKKIPRSKYLLKAMQRLATGKHRAELERIGERRRDKDRYYNANKGGRSVVR